MKNYRRSRSDGSRLPRSRAALAAGIILLLALNACSQDQPVNFSAGEYPDTLSAWQLMRVVDQRLQLHPAQTPYDLATPLFSDYALKLRTIWMPPGTSAKYRDSGALDFPIGTVISKTFYYLRDPTDPTRLLRSDAELPGYSATQGLDLRQVRLVETRLLVHQDDGWDALPYVWDDAQQEALLQPGGSIQRLALRTNETITAFAYIVPNQNECAACHVIEQKSDQLQPLGPAPRHLNRLFAFYPDGEQAQLQYWIKHGLLEGAAEDAVAPVTKPPAQADELNAAARAYLDINCGHCHQPGGSADTSGLFLHAAAEPALSLGICKPPVAAGRGTGGRRYSIVPGKPEDSILLFRVQSRELDVLMPELGRSLVHEEGVELLSDWIEQLEGECGPAPGQDTGLVSNFDYLEVMSHFHTTLFKHDRR